MIIRFDSLRSTFKLAEEAENANALALASTLP